MKEDILRLRKEGKTYNEIIDILGCSKSTVSYHCNNTTKEKSIQKTKELRKKNPLNRKYHVFKSRKFYNKYRDFQRRKADSFLNTPEKNFTLEELLLKIGNKPKCYLTGRDINLQNPDEYQLDHIIPVSKGGKNTLDNLGLSHADANSSKRDLSIDDFIKLCIEILEHNNYKVQKINN